jgi:putative ABC transport system permease protein
MAASLGGVAFAVMLMFVEMGFTNGMYDGQTCVVEKLNADLIIVNQFKETVVPKLPFPKRRLVQARAVPGVASTCALYIDEYRALWKNSQDGKQHPILVLAFDPDDEAFLIPEVLRQAPRLKVQDTVLIDSKSRDFFGELASGTTAELSGHQVRVVGTFPLGPDFRVDGNIITADRTFFKCLGDPRVAGTDASRVEFGLVRIAPGRKADEVRHEIVKTLPADVHVLTKRELIDRVKDYWGNSKPVGYVFGLGTFVGFVIGVTICYQILYTGIVDHLPQYATLKAIGYPNRYLVKVVLLEALYLATIGFFPGMLASLGVYAGIQYLSAIPMHLTVPRAAIVFVLTIVMCVTSGTIAIRKAITSDPAEVF